MSGVFREVEMTWGGETYVVTPSLSLLRRIEAQDISIPHLVNMMARGQPQPAQIATVTGMLLRAGGASVEDDEIYSELMNGDPDEVQALAQAVFLAIAPPVAEKKPRPAKRKPSRKKSTGRTGI